VLEAYDENTYLGNLNGRVVLSEKRALLWGGELEYTRLRGFAYDESYEGPADRRLGTHVVEYRDLHEDAYRCGSSLGLAYWRRCGTEDRRVVHLWSLTWDRHREHSQPAYVEGIEPYYDEYYTLVPPTVQFTGVDRRSDRLGLRYAFGELDPDARALRSRPGRRCLAPLLVVEKLSAELSFTAGDNQQTIVNRWERDGQYYWGVTDRQDQYDYAELNLAHALRLYLFKYGFLAGHYQACGRLDRGRDERTMDVWANVSVDAGGRWTIAGRYLFEVRLQLLSAEVGVDVYDENDGGGGGSFRFGPGAGKGVLAFRFVLLR
jgi:hypothetical protein